MFTWFIDNLAKVLICLALAAAITGIIIVMIRNQKKGKSSCGCGCSGCAMTGSCDLLKDNKTTNNNNLK
ncbi:MAG TPA: FeoB-associated Cys-rich membrane protein [Oscillospiraceae bacterium]|nr:FeoB-associated Cys-rich membrane protein [Oscillospiraceae bacterium]HPS33971.1 FeoB-associated Cys-rich membrane protein [Oscillospiraceae bacterium]